MAHRLRQAPALAVAHLTKARGQPAGGSKSASLTFSDDGRLRERMIAGWGDMYMVIG